MGMEKGKRGYGVDIENVNKLSKAIKMFINR